MIDHRWGPAPLPLLLEAELRSHGLGASDAAECARRLGETTGRAARASLFVDLGACSFLSGDVEAAIGSWRRAVSAGQPASHARALLFLGLVYEQLGLSELAISVLTTAVDQQVEPHAHQATTALARAYRASGDFDAAIDQLATATEHQMRRSPEGAETAESLLALGEVAHEAGQVDRAESAWRAAARGDTPPARLAHLQLVSLLCELGRENEARELIERGGLPGDETDAHQRLDRAIFLSERGRSGQAVELLASVNGAALRPADRFRLIETCLREGLVNEAIDDLELLLADPEPAHSLRAAVLLGDVYRLHDMDDEARAMYERATEADHAYWSPWAALTLGDVMFAEGDSEAAVANWVRAASSTVEEMQQLARGA